MSALKFSNLYFHTMKGQTQLGPVTRLATPRDLMEKAKLYLALFLIGFSTVTFALDFWPLALHPSPPFKPGIGLILALSLLSVISGGVVLLHKRDESDDEFASRILDRKLWMPLSFGLLNLTLGVVTLVFQLWPILQCWSAPPLPGSYCPTTHSMLGTAVAVAVCCAVIIVVFQLFLLVVILRQVQSRFLATTCSGNLNEDQCSLFWKSPKDDDAHSARSGAVGV